MCLPCARPYGRRLSGHERGSFTGAYERSSGKIEKAHQGTAFLDEISELPLPLQPRLLRILQEREFARVGGAVPIKTNVRTLAATNLDLYDLVQKGVFRSDLYYRLKVVRMTVPPLRERRDDIPVLAEHFLMNSLFATAAPRLGSRRAQCRSSFPPIIQGTCANWSTWWSAPSS